MNEQFLNDVIENIMEKVAFDYNKFVDNFTRRYNPVGHTAQNLKPGQTTNSISTINGRVNGGQTLYNAPGGVVPETITSANSGGKMYDARIGAQSYSRANNEVAEGIEEMQRTSPPYRNMSAYKNPQALRHNAAKADTRIQHITQKAMSQQPQEGQPQI